MESKLLIDLRHSELGRLYAAWRLARDGRALPSSVMANARALSEWQEHLLILNRSKTLDQFIVSHRGVASTRLAVSNREISQALQSVAESQRPLMIELSDEVAGRTALALLPFAAADARIDCVVIASYPVAH